MRRAVDLLSDYAAYHRDRRNIVTHLVGVPMIVFAVCVLLSRPAFAVGTVFVSPVWAVLALSSLWYLSRGAFALGLVTSAAMVLMVAAAERIAAGSTATWLGVGVGLFLVGWVIQFIGHHYEGRKPAFVDDIVGLMIGPYFVVAEIMFAAGWNKPLLAEIERRVGPTHLRDISAVRP